MVRQDTSEDVRATTRDLADKLTDKAVDAGVRAADSLSRAVAEAQERGERIAAQGAELSDSVQKVATNFSKALDKSVAQQPMTTLGMAVAAGFVLGALWKA